VKMLGQEDLDPGAVSAAPDSYQSAKPWKRMIVISAGVVMNVVLAAFLFIIVFLVGLDVEPAKIGSVAPGSPADTAVALNADELGVDEAGLRPGDVVTRSNDRPPNSFQDLVLASAMGGPKRPVRFEVERAGFSEPLRFRITPERGRLSGLYEIGITPFRSARLFDVESEAEQELLGERLAEIGAGGVEPGMTFTRIDGVEVERGAHQLAEAARDSGGEPLALEGDFIRCQDFHGTPAPAQQPWPPLMICGGSKKILEFAGAEADIVSLNFNNRAGALGPDGMSSGLAAATAKKVDWVRTGAGARRDEIELEIGAYNTLVTDQPLAAAGAIGEALGMDAQDILSHPHCLIGSVDSICEELERRREEYGISCVTVLDDGQNDMVEVFAPVVARLAGK